MASLAVEASKKPGAKTSREIFKGWLTLMDKYSDYFFNEPWPKKWTINRAIDFTSEDEAFIDEKEDEFADRVFTVCLKKNISFEGFNSLWGMYWSEQAFDKKFIKPQYQQIYEAFKEMAKTDVSAEEILDRLIGLREERDVDFIHISLIELLKEPTYEPPWWDLKCSEVLELIHQKYVFEFEEDEEKLCRSQRQKLKKTNQ